MLGTLTWVGIIVTITVTIIYAVIPIFIIYYAPDTVRGTGDKAMHKTDLASPLVNPEG